jgi:hypothetical protein
MTSGGVAIALRTSSRVIEDYPRGREPLLDRVNLAQARLAEWEREHL